MKILTLEPITKEGFAPFGQVAPRPKLGEKRVELIAELKNLRDDARPRLGVVVVAATPLPYDVTKMERHRYSSQAFVPGDCEGYLVLVAPHHPDGGPDPSGLRAFLVPGDTMINYDADIWHHHLTAFGRTAHFTSLTFVAGTPDDDEFFSLAEAVRIVEKS